ncbi:hypothetical protein HDR60_02130 [bacterium]|nr:hypothetical protein [bacterium]
MDNDAINLFYKKFNTYYKKLNNINDDRAKDTAIEFAFYDLKNKFGDKLDLRLLIEIPELLSYLKRNPKGERSSFHFGKDNSPITQLNTALSQKYL